jgi:hypothetical protein
VNSIANGMKKFHQARGLVLDLEPQNASQTACTAKLGMSYAQLLHQLSVRLKSQGQQLAVYDQQWQYHGIDSVYNYDVDGLAAGRVVVGITYDGKGNYSGAAAFQNWQQRLLWLLQPEHVADPALVAAGLTTDSCYTTDDVAARVKALSNKGIHTIHVFANDGNVVPQEWANPMSAFLSEGTATHKTHASYVGG